jgi:hypothetical protein
VSPDAIAVLGAAASPTQLADLAAGCIAEPIGERFLLRPDRFTTTRSTA